MTYNRPGFVLIHRTYCRNGLLTSGFHYTDRLSFMYLSSQFELCEANFSPASKHYVRDLVIDHDTNDQPDIERS